MSSLPISVNRKVAHSSAWLLSILFSILILGVVILAFLGKIDWGGPIAWVSGFLVFGWLILAMSFEISRLFRLSSIEGILLELKEDGFVDNYSHSSRFITWDQVEYIEWKDVKVIRVFHVVLKEKSFLESFKAIFGVQKFRFPEQYLSVSPKEISNHLLTYAPNNILR